MPASSVFRSLFSGVALLGMTLGAQAAILNFNASLDGPSENPQVVTPAFGFASVVIDDVTHTISINASFAGLIGTTTAAHIHCCVAPPGNVGVAVTPGTLTGFPVGVTSGAYSNSFDLQDLSTYTAAFVANFGSGTVAGAEAALIAGLVAGEAYFNIHTSFRPGGEIRGFLQQTPIPGALPLFASGLGVLGLYGWRRKRRATAA
jgi:hypothetical protein